MLPSFGSYILSTSPYDLIFQVILSILKTQDALHEHWIMHKTVFSELNLIGNQIIYDN